MKLMLAGFGVVIGLTAVACADRSGSVVSDTSATDPIVSSDADAGTVQPDDNAVAGESAREEWCEHLLACGFSDDFKGCVEQHPWYCTPAQAGACIDSIHHDACDYADDEICNPCAGIMATGAHGGVGD